MSEEILKALMQLFAIIAKQDAGVETKEVKFVETFLTSQLSVEQVEEYMNLFTKHAELEEKKRRRAKKKATSSKSALIKVGDSVRVMGICRKINKTLNQKQKVIVLSRLFELVNSEKKLSEQRMAIITAVADAFNISKPDFKEIEDFVIIDNYQEIDSENILIVNDKEFNCNKCKKIKSESLHGSVIILQIKSADLYFLKYTGKQDVYLNSTAVYNNRIYLFPSGSTVKLPKGKPVYYSDVVSHYMADLEFSKLSYVVDNIQYVFKTGDVGIQDLSFSVSHGKLVGIMGASGSGKTTLVNCLSGINSPSQGKVLINGIDLHNEKSKLEGVIGYIPQDDLLIEELTVFQNLYYNAKLCFKDKEEEDLVALVNKTLKDLGLFDKKDLKVGNAMNKTISGGQRKRLNIALELIREPSILFVDEPTSGLSSRDSENVMELLSEITQKGKLIFVVIHQPSSIIYKMFDRMLILDQGGHLIYYGNPVEAVVYFKTIDNQINSGAGECPVCGNITPEIIFDIIEAEVVDEFGQYTDMRKVSAKQWNKHFKEKIKLDEVESVDNEPPKTLSIPTWFNQFRIFLTRDILSKISNKQYIILNLVESPLLGFILAFLIRYIADPTSSVYIFYDNENIPPYIFMSIVVALFLGLTVSAEEIFRDRKILKREKFLNLSRSSYLMSKIIILTVISAIQAFLFVIIGNSILGIRDMYFEYWLVLFSIFVFANMMGLNISATFNSAVTIYILIPLLMIPQMSLGGAMFSFSKLNRVLGSVEKVPLVAEFMASRWAYEALMVYQFKENRYEQPYFKIQTIKSTANFRKTHYIKELENSIGNIENIDRKIEEENVNIDSINKVKNNEFALLINEIKRENSRLREYRKELIDNGIDITIEDTSMLVVPNELVARLNIKDYDEDEVGEIILEHFDAWKAFYSEVHRYADEAIEYMKSEQEKRRKGYVKNMREKFHNSNLEDIVVNRYETNKILRYHNRLVRQEEPIYQMPDKESFIGFRSHFYAPKKYFLGKYYNTFGFDVVVIWLMSILLYIPLYFEHLKKIINFAGEAKIFKKKARVKDSKKVEKKTNKKEN